MKSILVHIRDDSGQADRLAVALDLARQHGAHLSCVQVTPFTAFVIADPLGGMFVSPSVLEALREREDAMQARVEEEIRGAGISWDWRRFDGEAARAIVSRTRLADLVILSLPDEVTEERAAPLPIIPDVAIHAGAPVLALPREAGRFAAEGPVAIAWNGTLEAAHSLRAAVSLLRRAASVHIITVPDDSIEVPASEASDYLARYDIVSHAEELARRDEDVATTLGDTALALGAGYMVMGAYGHSRLRESILGSVTAHLVAESPVPLLLHR